MEVQQAWRKGIAFGVFGEKRAASLGQVERRVEGEKRGHPHERRKRRIHLLGGEYGDWISLEKAAFILLEEASRCNHFRSLYFGEVVRSVDSLLSSSHTLIFTFWLEVEKH